MKQTILKTYKVQRVQETSRKYDADLVHGGIVRSPGDGADIFREVLQTDKMTKEHLFMMSLNTKNKVEAIHIVHVGSINASITHPREIFQLALLDNATSILIGHNHPSGDTSPSKEDLNVTKRIKDAGKLMGIELLDHLILGDKFTSLKEKGYC